MRIVMQKLLLRAKASARSRVGYELLQGFTQVVVRHHCCCRCCCWAATLGAKVIDVETHVNKSHRPENTRDACMCERAVTQ